MNNPRSAILKKYNYNYDYEWYSKELSASATSFELDTAGLEDGNYTLYLYPQCEDQYIVENNRAYTTFHVRAASTGELRTMTLPTALKVIEEEAFKGTKAQRIVIPSGCTTIGSQAFAFSDQLVRVVIPASVNTIAEDAFVGCESITIETTANSAAARFASAQGFEVIIK